MVIFCSEVFSSEPGCVSMNMWTSSFSFVLLSQIKHTLKCLDVPLFLSIFTDHCFRYIVAQFMIT